MAAIEPEELANRLYDRDDAPLVLDVRPEESFEDWHVPGSVNVPVYETLTEEPEAAAPIFEDLRAENGEEEIVTVCAAGVVSQTATEVMTDLGYDAATLTDGLAGWARVHRTRAVGVDATGTLLQIVRPGTGCLSYAVVSKGEVVVIDPSQYATEYEALVEAYDAELVAVLDTHAHADHVSGGRRLADRNDVPYRLHPADALDVDVDPLADGEEIDVGHVTIEVVHTPGHSPGSVTYAVDGEALFTGDALFHDSVGRVELGVEAGIEQGSARENAAALHESIERLLERSDDTLVLPTHDSGSPEPPVTATLGEVADRVEAVGLDRAAFVDRLAADVPDQPPNYERIKGANVGRTELDREEARKVELGPNRCAAHD